MKSEITIKEIARMAGVSVSTVSRVINHKPNVSPAKEAKIKQVIAESGFQPSMLARGMISNKTNTLGIIVPDITNPYFTALISQVELITRQLNFSLLLFNTMTAGDDRSTNSVATEIQAFQTIMEKKVDGLLILGGEIDREQPNTDYVAALKNLNNQIPVVVIGQPVAGLDCTFIPRYQAMSGQIITQHLLASGYQHIAFLGGEPGVQITKERLAGYQKMMNTYAHYDEQLVCLTDYYVSDGYDGMTQLLDQHADTLQAVVAINDQVALGAIRALNDHHLDCPRDIAIGSCDAFPNGAFFSPRLTTIDHHNTLLAKIAIERLINLATNTNVDEPLPTIEQPQLVIRESCGHQLRNGDDA
ncbi:LacI family DNA-binding transcriptional regulator [Lactiplantibacillus fabifermentans]|uniref:Laci family transcriptional regulator n=2 Tax=Lactiplantibacillus fabifermentans TaxID=483011 RepID=A0A0R2NV02_9LACO|nr:LacI family DNA-binding transcriptional regulator [Lactiplantibacillus fabifermentans]ETY72993.1 LacI family transcription regulator [Lactiplantibacillus fabifermentans T30PCM01]KRO27667.1 laci family transcriptional regulator [Lactiplantibacillus fabifermentans DSM 21115]